jgi:D-alanyl-D-alanine carboxypeptidase/D-alanyl-D-alanine-endopeptidase (penicillin-binding protein 4)
VLAVAGLTALAALAATTGPPVTPAGPATPLAPATPLLSVRRVPVWVERTVAAQRLAAGMPAILAGLGPAASSSCLVVTEGGRTLYADHPASEVLPASNMKLLTATAVLGRLGASSRITTRVRAAAPPVRGVVHGDLYLVGHGDPLLWTPGYAASQAPAQTVYTSLATLASQVRAAGITRVTGTVVGDEAWFDTERGVAGWKAAYEQEGDVGPLSALDVDDGFMTTPPYGPSPQPAKAAAALLAGLRRADGVAVGGPVRVGATPADAAAVAAVTSPPLGAEVGVVLRVSDDTGAELLLKQLGRRATGTGSTQAGVTAERAVLAADGLPVTQLLAADGSGLSRADRVTCGLVAADLRLVGTTGPIFAGLPVAGRTGTLTTRFVGTVAAGRLHAKTGTLDGVSALSGFVLARRGRDEPDVALRAPLVFSFIANGLSGTVTGPAVGDAIGVALARYPEVPPLAAAEPLPLRRR